ncbi:MFS transporter [Alloalcanivorax mobilis]|uniref:MFS transporter n=1 Tax=Alloalcanivorax mobilis TaxID=2019569 RepID=UPI001E3AB794|nr:MFS transporter [Alloalcanivorax mobilis]
MTAIDHTDAEQGLPVPRRYWALLATALSIGMAVMDNTIVNVALPAIAEQLRIAPAQSIWVVNGYLLAVAIALLPLSSLGEIIGYGRVYRGGLLVFTVASLLCALSDSLVTLTAARFLQGLGAAGIMSVNVALVRFIFPARSLGKGVGINAMVVAVSTGIGPTAAAGILSVGTWPWLFAINVPIGCLAMVMAARTLPHTPRSSHRFDVISALLNAFGIGLLVIAIDSLAHGVPGWVILVELVSALLILYWLVRRQLSRPSPLLPVDLLKIRPFALAVGTSMCAFTGQTMAYITLPFYLHDGLGYSAVWTGLLMTPWPLAVIIMAPIAGHLADRYAAGALCGLGLALQLVGLILLATMPDPPMMAAVLASMALCGFGFGLFHAPNNRTLMSSAPPHRSGGAAGMQGTARLIGQTLGASLTALIFGLFPQQAIPCALLVAAGAAGMAALVSLLRLRTPASP